MYALEHYDEIDDLYRRKQKRRVALFLTTLAMSGACLGGGLYANNIAKSKTMEQYEYVIVQAENALERDDKLRLYEEAIGIDPTLQEGYLEYLAICEDDKIFNIDECDAFEQIYEKYKKTLKTNNEAYVSVNFKYACILWYYYSYSDGEKTDVNANGSQRAVRHFKEVLDNSSESSFENYKFAEMFYNIADLNDKIDSATSFGSGGISDLWENVKNLVSLSASNCEKQDYKYILPSATKTFFYIIDNHIEALKENGVKKSEIEEVYENVKVIYASPLVNTEIPSATDKSYQIKMDTTYGN